MSRKITKLSVTQERELVAFREKWLSIGLSTEPADRPRFESAVSQMYQEIGKKPPQFIWLSSPAMCVLAIGVLRGLDKKLRDQLRGQLGGQLWGRFDGQHDSYWMQTKHAGGCWQDVTHDRLLSLCPFGVPGERLWLRENCRAHEWSDAEAVECFEEAGGQAAGLVAPEYGKDVVVYEADGFEQPIDATEEAAQRWLKLYHYAYKRGATVPSIHMPRWASRLTLEITDVRVERVSDISVEDAKAEGVEPLGSPGDSRRWRAAFRELWDSLNPDCHSWEANPWVWVVEFRKVEAV